MLGLFKKKKRYDFDEEDTELAALRVQAKKIRNQIERQRLRNLKLEASNLRFGDRETASSPLHKVLRDIRDLDAIRNELTPEQQEALETGDVDSESKLLLQLVMQGLNANKNVPETQEELKESLASNNIEKPKDRTEQIINALPKQVRDGIASGKIPKVVAKKASMHMASQEFENVWQKLTKKPSQKRLNKK